MAAGADKPILRARDVQKLDTIGDRAREQPFIHRFTFTPMRVRREAP